MTNPANPELTVQALREQFQHLYWIGGGGGAGKSTIARRVAGQHDLHVYGTDDVMADHARRSTNEWGEQFVKN